MPRRGKRVPPRRFPTEPLKQSHSQSLSDDALEAEDQSSAQLSLDISVVSTATGSPPVDTGATDDAGVTEPIEDAAVPEPTQITQPACDIGAPVQLEIELVDDAGNTAVETRSV